MSSPQTPNHVASIERAIFTLLDARAPTASICPSEVARDQFPSDWRDHMGEVRAVAVQLALSGKLVITQGSKTLDPNKLHGPIRLRRTNP